MQNVYLLFEATDIVIIKVLVAIMTAVVTVWIAEVCEGVGELEALTLLVVVAWLGAAAVGKNEMY